MNNQVSSDAGKSQTLSDTFRGFDFSTNGLMTLGGYAVGGFLAGFLLKNFGRLLISIIVCTIVIVSILQYFNIITVHYGAIKSLLGVTDQYTLHDFFTYSRDWVKAHVAESIASIVGFFIAWLLT